MKCSACNNPYHPASGHAHSERTVLCGVCARAMLKWYKGQMSRRSGGVKFYDHVTHPERDENSVVHKRKM